MKRVSAPKNLFNKVAVNQILGAETNELYRPRFSFPNHLYADWFKDADFCVLVHVASRRVTFREGQSVTLLREYVLSDSPKNN